jgi:hypothetical protein
LLLRHAPLDIPRGTTSRKRQRARSL